MKMLLLGFLIASPTLIHLVSPQSIHLTPGKGVLDAPAPPPIATRII